MNKSFRLLIVMTERMPKQGVIPVLGRTQNAAARTLANKLLQKR